MSEVEMWKAAAGVMLLMFAFFYGFRGIE